MPAPRVSPQGVRLHVGPEGCARTETFKEELQEFGRTIQLTVSSLQDHLVPGKEIADKPIIVELRGPCMPDLTLVDLPGLIMEKRGEPMKAKNIMKLVKSKISSSSAILLTVAQATNHIDNCQGLMLSREVDRDQGRTLGVFTKVDMVMGDGQERENLRQAARALVDGSDPSIQSTVPFFVTSNPPQSDIDSGRADVSRKKIEEYFDGYEDRVGIQALARALERKLAVHVAAELPKAYDRLKLRHEILGRELGEITRQQGQWAKKKNQLAFPLTPKEIELWKPLVQINRKAVDDAERQRFDRGFQKTPKLCSPA